MNMTFKTSPVRLRRYRIWKGCPFLHKSAAKPLVLQAGGFFIQGVVQPDAGG